MLWKARFLAALQASLYVPGRWEQGAGVVTSAAFAS